eukprot:CAMPEP_0170301330 /NCGR_PEP_ID=MMETSP0116_2-20130129/50922_1 /TAXON_ID=400756 /ORGANISM="Durinskia baltica, Strain CSIRO CS-38" /LENGTH=85 /DNA_ID=CAMNT_0010553147 /DNA_START=105 /DNA_END=358 /DNA_ORIENTATION=-
MARIIDSSISMLTSCSNAGVLARTLTLGGLSSLASSLLGVKLPVPAAFEELTLVITLLVIELVLQSRHRLKSKNASKKAPKVSPR